MKYITKPETTGVVGLEALARWLVNTDERFNRTGPGIRAGVRVEDACAACEGQAFLELQPEHHALLAAAAEEPTAGYPPLRVTFEDGRVEDMRSARPWLACIDAIRDAGDEAPKAEPTDAEPAR